MPTPITPVPQLSVPLTIAGTDAPNSAGMLAVLQTHANRAEFLLLRNALQLRRLARADPSAALAIGVHELAGHIVLVGPTTFARVSLGYPGAENSSFSAYTYQEGVTLPGSPTLTSPVRDAHGGTNGYYLLFVSGGYSYQFTRHVGAGTQVAFQFITTARDVLWSSYRGRFIVVGAITTGVGSIESSPDGNPGSWAQEQVNIDNPAGGWHRIAGDATGRYLLACSAADNYWTYSSDGGDTWAAPFTKTIGGDNSYTLTGLAYDDSRGLWLATFDGSTFAGSAQRVWTVADPVAGTWATSGTDIPNFGLGATDTAYACSVVPVRDGWLVGAAGLVTSVNNVWLTRDAGATWEMPLGAAEDGAPIGLRRSGAYVTIGASAGVRSAITGRLWT